MFHAIWIARIRRFITASPLNFFPKTASTLIVGGLVVLLSACATPSALQKPASQASQNKTPPSTAPTPNTKSTDCINPALNIDAQDFRCLYPQNANADRPLWERIRNGLNIPDLNTGLAANRTEWYARQPAYFDRMTKRSEKYLFHIVEEVEKRNMPMEIALLPFIESAFVAKATSSARAAGLWQFIPSTGREFDLRQNGFRDDRRDVLASTSAALDYLQLLYNRFGDWHLALAAYNWGQGNVGRAIAKNQSRGLGSSYTELTMPRETREYVPKLQAIENIIRNPELYGITLPHIANHPYFQVIDITKDIDVELVTELAQISVEEFRQLNPSFNKPVILAEGTPQILLPWNSADTFLKNLKKYQDGPLATWTAWQLPTSMRLAEVATLFDIDVEDLEEANLISAKRIIKSGSTLLVPRDESQTDNVSALVADNAQVRFQAERIIVKKKRFIRHAKSKKHNKLVPKKETARKEKAQNRKPEQTPKKSNANSKKEKKETNAKKQDSKC